MHFYPEKIVMMENWLNMCEALAHLRVVAYELRRSLPNHP
jgi:hypothetical protein